jgi:hypothetical protein
MKNGKHPQKNKKITKIKEEEVVRKNIFIYFLD